MHVWLVLRYEPLQVMGIYTTEKLAVAACFLPVDVIGKVEIDKPSIDEGVDWVGAYYPLARQGDDHANT